MKIGVASENEDGMICVTGMHTCAAADTIF